MTKSFRDRLAEIDRASYVDVSRDMLPVNRGAKRAHNCVEDRTNAHVMRENGMTANEICERFGYLPEALPDPVLRQGPT